MVWLMISRDKAQHDFFFSDDTYLKIINSVAGWINACDVKKKKNDR